MPLLLREVQKLVRESAMMDLKNEFSRNAMQGLCSSFQERGLRVLQSIGSLSIHFPFLINTFRVLIVKRKS